MKNLSTRSFATATVALLLAGCSANHHSIYRSHTNGSASKGDVNIALIDAKQRAIMSQKTDEKTIVCSEPSPDVFAVLASSFGASGSFGNAAKDISGAFESMTSESGASFGLRTQTITALRDMMFYLCQYHMSGSLDEADVRAAMHRQGKLLTAILAIEQLTGVSSPTTVEFSAEGSDIEINPPVSNSRNLGEEEEQEEQGGDDQGPDGAVGDAASGDGNGGGGSNGGGAGGDGSGAGDAAGAAAGQTGSSGSDGASSQSVSMKRRFTNPLDAPFSHGEQAMMINTAYQPEQGVQARVLRTSQCGKACTVKRNEGQTDGQPRAEDEAKQSAKPDNGASQTGVHTKPEGKKPGTGPAQADTAQPKPKKPEEKPKDTPKEKPVPASGRGTCCRPSDAAVAAVKSIVETVYADDEIENLCLTKLLKSDLDGFALKLCQTRLIVGAAKKAQDADVKVPLGFFERTLDAAFGSSEAVESIADLRARVDALPYGVAGQIILNLPVDLDLQTFKRVTRELGDPERWQQSLHENGDSYAKRMLRFIITQADDRSAENLQRWLNAFEQFGD